MFSAAAMCTVGRQGWSLMAETKWGEGRGGNFHAGAFLAINDNSRFDFTYYRQSWNGAIMYQLRFGCSRRILVFRQLAPEISTATQFFEWTRKQWLSRAGCTRPGRNRKDQHEAVMRNSATCKPTALEQCTALLSHCPQILEY